MDRTLEGWRRVRRLSGKKGLREKYEEGEVMKAVGIGRKIDRGKWGLTRM